MTRSRVVKLLIALGACGAVAVVVGIASSSASTSSAPAHHRFGGFWGGGATGASGFHGPGGGPFGPGGGGIGRPGLIHSVAVVPNTSGGFDTVTTDSGTVVSVSSNDVKLTEGTKTATYATPTITVASGAKVTLDGKASELSALVAGDRVTISQSSAGTTTVFAADASFKGPPAGGFGHFRRGPFPGGPPGMGGTGPSGPPPTGGTGATGATG